MSLKEIKHEFLIKTGLFRQHETGLWQKWCFDHFGGVNFDPNFQVCFGVGVIPTCSPLCSRVSASSGDAAEGLAPPRGGDRHLLKPFLIPQTRTGPPASSQPPHRAPIHPDVRQQRSRSPRTFGGSNQPLWSAESNEELTQPEKPSTSMSFS